MIATIDDLRKRHNDAIGEAMIYLADIAHMTSLPAYNDLESQYLEAMVLINTAADEEIERLARAADDDDGQTVIHVGGDYIQVGNISDSENIAIGKDIRQSG